MPRGVIYCPFNKRRKKTSHLPLIQKGKRFPLLFVCPKCSGVIWNDPNLPPTLHKKVTQI